MRTAQPSARVGTYLSTCLLLFGLVASGSALSQIPAPDQGKLIETGGVSEIEGAGGGGLTPWALITGYGSDQSYGANAHATAIQTADYLLLSQGIAVGLFDRLEASFANQRFSATAGALKGVAIREQISGLKLSVLGDAVYAQDSVVPQIAIGAQYHDNRGITGLQSLGVAHPVDLGVKTNSAADYYLSLTKILLDQSLLLNATVRYTDANQFGLLGFAGDRNTARQAMFEGSLAYLLSRHMVVGIEYRQMPHNLTIDDERAAYDAFVAWLPNHNLSFTLALVSLGTILKPFEPRQQNGLYLSTQVGF